MKMTKIQKLSEEDVIDSESLELKVSMDEFKKWLGIEKNRRFGYSLEEKDEKNSI